MGRSVEAIRKRAAKRNRSEQEQRRLDAADARKCRERSLTKEAKERGSTSANDILAPHPAPPSNESHAPVAPPKPTFASNGISGIPRVHVRTVTPPTTPPRRKTRPDIKHKFNRNHRNNAPAKWDKPQASAEKVAQNQELRERYAATQGEGMNEADIDRAKQLLERSERKKQRKAAAKAKKVEQKNNRAMPKKALKAEGNKDSKGAQKTPSKNTLPVQVESKSKEDDAREEDTKEEAKHTDDVAGGTQSLEDSKVDTTAVPSSSEVTEEQPKPLIRRGKRPTPMDLAWRQVALDEAAGRLPEFVATTETEKKLERIAERNRKNLAEIRRIRKLMAEDEDAGLEAIGKFASGGSGGDSAASSNANEDDSSADATIQDTSTHIKPKKVGKAMKKALKAASGRSMKMKKLRKSVQAEMSLPKSEKKKLRRAINARIEEKRDVFKLDGKIVSLVTKDE